MQRITLDGLTMSQIESRIALKRAPVLLLFLSRKEESRILKKTFGKAVLMCFCRVKKNLNLENSLGKVQLVR